MAPSKRRRLATGAVRAARRAMGGLAAVRGALLVPRPLEGVPVVNAADAPLLPSRPLKLLTWNIQFGAGRKHAFFYDYGRAVSVPKGDVEDALEGIAGVLRRHDPDLVVLQEVDRGARRTGYVDEHTRLVQATGYPCHASTPYWRALYVPHPRHEHFGKVDLHLSVFSRFRLGKALRRVLPPKKVPLLERWLGVQRALFEVEVLRASGPLVLVDVHLEAFSYADGTLPRQIAALDHRLAEYEAHRTPWIAAGDYNSLAPGDDKEGLNAFERSLYPEGDTDLRPLFERWSEPVGDGWKDDPSKWRTFLPFGESEPDRTLDYVFHGGRVRVHEHRVLLEEHRWSDHLPLLTTFEVTP